MPLLVEVWHSTPQLRAEGCALICISQRSQVVWVISTEKGHFSPELHGLFSSNAIIGTESWVCYEIHPNVHIHSSLTHAQSCLMDLLLSTCVCGIFIHLGYLTDRAELRRQGWLRQDVRVHSHSVFLPCLQESTAGAVPQWQCSRRKGYSLWS